MLIQLALSIDSIDSTEPPYNKFFRQFGIS